MAQKILILTIGKYPHLGGKSVHIDNLEKLLPKHSIAPRVVSFSDLGLLEKSICSLPRLFSNLSLDFSLRRFFLAQKLRLIDPKKDCPLYLVQDTPAYPLAKDKPFILTIHGSAADEYASQKEIEKNSPTYLKLLHEEISAAQKASAVITVDTNLKNQIMARSHIDSSKVTVLPNAVDSNLFYPPLDKSSLKKQLGFSSDDYLTLVLRRLVPKNGVKYAILALSLLQRQQVKLLIAGEGPEKASLERLVSSLNLNEQVIFWGAVPHEKTPRLLQAADLALIPSIPDRNVIEATSISALEAMASSLPIIASSIGGLVELLAPDLGLLIPPKNSEALSKAWRQMIDNPKQALAFGSRARQKVLQEYSVTKWCKTYAKLIANCLRGDSRCKQ